MLSRHQGRPSTQVFHVIIGGTEISEELYAYAPLGVVVMYVVLNLFLFLVMSQVRLKGHDAARPRVSSAAPMRLQVFIAIVCGACASVPTGFVSQSAESLPDS